MPLVLITEELDPECVDWLAKRCDVEVAPASDPRFPDLLARAEGLVVRTYTHVTREFLEGAPNLRAVGRAGVALENVDVPACRERGIQVVHTPRSNSRAVVEFVTAMILDALRPRIYLDRAPSPAQWHNHRRTQIARRELNEMTLGIWGFGRIGSSMARVGAAMDMRVIYYDIREIDADGRHGAEPVDLPTLLAESDVLTMHVDYRASNTGILNAEALARTKPDALLVNSSRGFVVDAPALAAHLRATPNAAAALDVHDPSEPLPADYPLLGIPNARLTPHLASGTTKAKRDMSWVVRDVHRVLTGEPPEFPPPPWLLEQA